MRQLYLSMLAGSTASMAMQYLDSVVLSRWTFEARGPTSKLGGQKHLSVAKIRRRSGMFLERLEWGWEEAFRARSAGTAWEVKNLPAFYPAQPNRVPTKGEFLRWSVWRALYSFLIVDVISYLGRDVSMNRVNFAAGKVPFFSRLGEVTAEEIVLRVMSSMLHWVVFVFLLQGLYDVAAIGVVGLGWGRIERWPPLFNSWKECWSVRRFWGSFWHQGTRQKFLAPANFLSFSILRLTPGTLVARYTVLILTFMVSGIHHQLGDVATGVPWEEAGAARFYLMQALGIMIEDTVQGTYRFINGSQRTDTRPKGWKAVLGFCWLFVWLIWTSPSWVYPVAQRSSGEAILPFSVLRSGIR